LQTGLVFDIQRFSLHDGPGIRTTVFLLGCPLSCWWCHNPESQGKVPQLLYGAERCLGCQSCVAACPEHALTATEDGIHTDGDLCKRCWTCTTVCPTTCRETTGRPMTVAEVMTEIEKDRVFYEESGGGVTFSGGEPLMQPDFLLDLLRACGDRGIHRAVDTAGVAREEILCGIAGETELFLYDLKLMDASRHHETTGAENDLILTNLEHLAAMGCEINVRIPIIAGINDDDENIDSAGAFLSSLSAETSVSLLPFHESARDKHRKFDKPWRLDGAQAVSDERMQDISSRIEEFGLNVRIGG
jgi:pyruvate formate lyase activating enzyme